MTIIKKEKNQIKLNFSPQIYSKKIILEASKDFENICKTKIEETNDRILVTMDIKAKDMKPEKIGYEFYNYVLGLMKNKAEV